MESRREQHGPPKNSRRHFEIGCRTRRAYAQYGLRGAEQFRRVSLRSRTHQEAHSGGVARTELPSNYFARSLRVQRADTIGVIARDLADAYAAMIISGIERYLRQQSFLFLMVAHHNDKKLLDTYSHIFLQRGVEGLISVDTTLDESMPLPTIAIASHRRLEGVTNILLDHRRAVLLALKHLIGLGHREIAFMKGPLYSSDSIDRWKAVIEVAQDLGIEVRPELTIQLDGDLSTPEVAYPATKRFLRSQTAPFTALFAFNDNSALGAMSAFQKAGLHVPERHISRRLRRHQDGAVQQPAADDGAPASSEDGRDRGALLAEPNQE